MSAPAEMAAMDDLRVLIAAATPGPWQMDDESTVCANNEVIAVPCGVFGRDQQDADMALIIAAVNALPGLLDRLAAVEKQRDDAVQELTNIRDAKVWTWEQDAREHFYEWAQSRARHTLAAIAAIKGEG